MGVGGSPGPQAENLEVDRLQRSGIRRHAAEPPVALFAVGATLSLFTGRAAIASGTRMLLLGSLAAAVTFAVGKLFGVSIS